MTPGPYGPWPDVEKKLREEGECVCDVTFAITPKESRSVRWVDRGMHYAGMVGLVGVGISSYIDDNEEMTLLAILGVVAWQRIRDMEKWF